MIRNTGSTGTGGRSKIDTKAANHGYGCHADTEKSYNYKAAQESMQAGLKPPWALFDNFMREADLMVTYKRYGKKFFEEVSFICSKFEVAYADNDIDQMVELYGDLETLKIKAVLPQA